MRPPSRSSDLEPMPLQLLTAQLPAHVPLQDLLGLTWSLDSGLPALFPGLPALFPDYVSLLPQRTAGTCLPRGSGQPEPKRKMRQPEDRSQGTSLSRVLGASSGHAVSPL